MSRTAVLPLLFALSACSSAAFDVAGDPADALEGDDAANSDVELLDTGDAGDALLETGPGEVRDSKPHDDTTSPLDSGTTTDTSPSSDTSPADAGCTLHDHYEPVSGKKYTSCLPSGVPGDGSTYSSALFDDEIAHCDAETPAGCSWGPPTPITCGAETCFARAYSCAAFDGGTAASTWCVTGSLAGWITGGEGVGKPAICPTTDVHGVWW